MGESRSQPNSRTAGGRPQPQWSNNNGNARGSQATSGRQQPCPGGNPRQPNHRNPSEDLRQRINEGRGVWSIIDSRRREREVADTEGTDCSDRFPALTARFSSYKYLMPSLKRKISIISLPSLFLLSRFLFRLKSPPKAIYFIMHLNIFHPTCKVNFSIMSTWAIYIY
jgi:hypothetical protein